MENWYIQYFRELVLGYVACSVEPAGFCHAEVTCNVGTRAEIGKYRRKMPLEACRSLLGLLHKSNYTSIRTPPEVEPGTPMVSIGEGEGDADPELASFLLADLPKELLPFMEAMDPFIEQVRESPQQVLAGSAAWIQAAAPRESELVLHWTFGNIGLVPIEIVNPGAPLEDSLAAMLLSPNVSGAEVEEFSLTGEHIRLLPHSGQAPASKIPSTLEILPGDQVVLEVRKRLRLLPGVYKAALTYASLGEGIDSARAVVGTLAVEPGLLTITK